MSFTGPEMMYQTLATGLKLWNASFHHSFKVVVLEVGVGDLTLGTRLFVPANHVFQLISCKTS
jgi:hypothetical protein